MSDLQDQNIVKSQYQTSNKLETRISFHQKYSTNKQGYYPWIMSQYKFKAGDTILEMGCGNGKLWAENMDKIPVDGQIILADLSEGMLEEAKKNIPDSKAVCFQQMDIQKIPLKDKSVDFVIANMMLYHVPDMNLGLSEVKRVLKEDGTFACATFGKHGIGEYIRTVLSEYHIKNDTNESFILQNGKQILEQYFSKVEKRIYEDSLEVTDANDFVDYIMSLPSMKEIETVPRETIYELFDRKKVNGIIQIPKEYGMFLARI